MLGVLMKATVKESADGAFVLRTVDRSRLWEVQTPQVVRPALLREGFARVAAQGLVVEARPPQHFNVGGWTILYLNARPPPPPETMDGFLALKGKKV